MSFCLLNRRQVRILEPRRFGEGPHRLSDGAGCGGEGSHRAGLDDYRGDVREHGNRSGAGLCGPRLHLHHRNGREELEREGGHAEAPRRHHCADAHRGGFLASAGDLCRVPGPATTHPECRYSGPVLESR